MIQLVHSAPSPVMQKRMTRLLADARIVATLTRAEAKALYQELETVRDILSRVLDRADGKGLWDGVNEQS